MLGQLQSAFEILSEQDQASVVRFAQFLAQDEKLAVVATPAEKIEKKDIARPEEENVIKALKRLRETYPMISPDSVMKETTSQMTAHLIKGQDKSQTIDALESCFAQKYQDYLSTFD